MYAYKNDPIPSPPPQRVDYHQQHAKPLLIDANWPRLSTRHLGSLAAGPDVDYFWDACCWGPHDIPKESKLYMFLYYTCMYYLASYVPNLIIIISQKSRSCWPVSLHSIIKGSNRELRPTPRLYMVDVQLTRQFSGVSFQITCSFDHSMHPGTSSNCSPKLLEG